MSHAAPEGVLARAEEWVRDHVAPDIADLKATAGKVRELAPALEKIAAAVTAMAKVDPGLAPEVVADAEAAASVVARIAAELTAAGM